MSASASVRSLPEVVADIRRDWKKPYFAAVPYIQAMSELESVNDKVMLDSGREIVQRFLSNASLWRGETAKRCKAELRAMMK